MTDHCPACATARDLRAHRDAAYPDWSRKRATLNFAAIVADRNCPAWQNETGRQLANERDDLIAQGVDPADLLIPIHPEDA